MVLSNCIDNDCILYLKLYIFTVRHFCSQRLLAVSIKTSRLYAKQISKKMSVRIARSTVRAENVFNTKRPGSRQSQSIRGSLMFTPPQFASKLFLVCCRLSAQFINM